MGGAAQLVVATYMTASHKDRGKAVLHAIDEVEDVRSFHEPLRALEQAVGLGWSNPEHPGHLVFPLFARLLGGAEIATELRSPFDEVDSLMEDDRPRLRTPDVEALVALADPSVPRQAKKRAAMITGMRRAVEKRVAGVTSKKGRRHYGHAAFLAVMCLRANGSAETKAWLEELEREYRRFPALRREMAGAREELLARGAGTT